MKTIRIFCTLIVLAGCTRSGEKTAEDNPPDSTENKIPVVHLDDATEGEFKLSELIDDVQIIPLETRNDILVRNPQIFFSRDFIFVGMPGHPKPGRAFRFDYNGRYSNEIGKAGHGPGEHTGELTRHIHYFEEDSTIMVSWANSYNMFDQKRQLFSIQGDFLREIKTPYRGFTFVEKINDSTWFGSAFGTGPVRSKPDSSRITFFSVDGKLLQTIPRTTFPVQGYKPVFIGGFPSYYRYNNEWKVYYDGTDSLFKIKAQRLVADAVFANKKRIDFNSLERSTVDGKMGYSFLTETKRHWYLRKYIMEIVQGQINLNFDVPLSIVDKNSMKVRNGWLVDDIFFIFDEKFFETYFSMGRMGAQDDRLFFTVDAIDVVEMMKNVPPDLKPEAQRQLDKLTALKIDDNPVIFSFRLRDSPDPE